MLFVVCQLIWYVLCQIIIKGAAIVGLRHELKILISDGIPKLGSVMLL